MKGKQLLSKSEVLQDEIRTRPENAENPAKKMPQIRDHEQNLNGNAWNRDPFQVLDPTNPRGFEEAQGCHSAALCSVWELEAAA